VARFQAKTPEDSAFVTVFLGECEILLKVIFWEGGSLPVGEAYFRSPWWSWLAENIT
jgi:hypothetical protein